MGDEVVIIAADGTEHVFPPGFDPKQAASIVRGKSAPGLPARLDQKLEQKYPGVVQQLQGVERMDQTPFMGPTPGVISLAGKMAKAVPGVVRAGVKGAIGILGNPLVGGSVGAVEGYRRGGVESAIIGGAIGAQGGTQLARGLRRLAPKAKPIGKSAPAPPPITKNWTKPAQAPPSTPPATATTPQAASQPATTRTQADLHREVMARDPDWRTVDAVPVDAIKRDVTRGGSIIEAGESRIALGERLAAAVKAGDAAEVDRLARAIRQREHISARTSGARR